MRLTRQELRTRKLYGDIHALLDDSKVRARLGRILTAEHLGVPSDFLAGKSVLDAGTGGRGRALQDLYHLGSRNTVAVDLSDANIRNARATNVALDSFISFQTANLAYLPFADEQFDFVHCSGVVHHMAEPSRAVAEIHRCLKPKGHLYIAVYGKGGILYTTAAVGRALAAFIPYRVSRRYLLRVFGGDVASHLLDYLYVPQQFHYSEVDARCLVADAGFVNIRRLSQPATIVDNLWNGLLKPSSYNPKTRLGRLMAGSGWIILMAEKP